MDIDDVEVLTELRSSFVKKAILFTLLGSLNIVMAYRAFTIAAEGTYRAMNMNAVVREWILQAHETNSSPESQETA